MPRKQIQNRAGIIPLKSNYSSGLKMMMSHPKVDGIPSEFKQFLIEMAEKADVLFELSHRERDVLAHALVVEWGDCPTGDDTVTNIIKKLDLEYESQNL